MNFYKQILNAAKESGKTIVFPEGGFSDRILNAALKINKLKIAKPILVGDESALILRNKKVKNLTVINPKTSPLKSELQTLLYELRKDKGITKEQAEELILDPFYFSTMLLHSNYADGMVGGAEVSTARYLKPALQILKNANGEIVNSIIILEGKNKVTDSIIILADCSLVENPTDQQVALMAERAVIEYKKISNNVPKVAFLSYSTMGSAKSESQQKMKNAYEIFKKQNPDVIANGEVQFDAAVLEKVAEAKMPNEKFEKSANIFIFPEINSANICYKAMQQFGNLKAIGPVMVGMSKPANDLSRGCSEKEIICLAAVTALQCIDKRKKNESISN